MITLTIILLIVLYAAWWATAPSLSASMSVLRAREHRQTVALHRVTGTVRFFRRHPWLLRYGSEPNRWTARRELRHARIWVVVIRRELAETRSALKPKSERLHIACEQELLNLEGGMNPHSSNPYSGAYGGPQALPGEKMGSAGADWRDNIWTQIRWMRGYVVGRYGSMCSALSFRRSSGWY